MDKVRSWWVNMKTLRRGSSRIYYSPRIDEPSTADSNIQALIDIFMTCCAVDDEAEPTNRDLDVWQLQTPLLAGNVGWIHQHVTNHVIDEHGSGSNTAKVHALTVSCLQNTGLNVKTAVVPLFVAWKHDRIDRREVRGEVLGTVSANSCLPAHGHNVKQPGTRDPSRIPNDKSLERGKKHVLYYTSFFKENAEQSLKKLHDEALADKKAEAARQCDNLRRELECYKSLRDDITRAEAELEVTKDKIAATLQEAEAGMKGTDELLAEVDRLLGGR
jgi:hypothetical protein